MPKVGKTDKSSVTPKKNVSQITCASCAENLKISSYYVSYNPVNQHGRIPYCKSCLKNMISNENGNVELDKLKTTLQLIDRPFIYSLWRSSLEESGEDKFGIYMKNIAMTQYRKLGYADSRFLPEVENKLNYSSTDITNQDTNNLKIGNFDLTDEIIERWGYGFQPEEYLNFERKYKKLTKGYKEKTALHTERLDTYIIHKVKEEMATAKGDVAEAEKWAKLAQKDATDAKLNVSQLSKSDITGGIDLLPQLVEASEQYVSLIPLLPKVLAQPYDDADLIIWANINYLRHLEEKPFVPYRDIWNFYDKMLEEYYKQKGFSEEQIIDEKYKRNNVFRDLGEIYIEPLYENPDEFIEENGDSDEFI